MKPRDFSRAQGLDQALTTHGTTRRALPGVQDPVKRGVFVQQLIESLDRVRYVSVVRARRVSPLRGDPSSDLFDPLKAAILRQADGEIDEACWLVFLFVHFGRHARAGWRYAREVYGRLGGPGRWDWASVRAEPLEFRRWLDANRAVIERPGIPRGFGNHRKYETLDAWSPSGTGEVVESYVHWVASQGGHAQLFTDAQRRTAGDPHRMFDDLYRAMSVVRRFGRLARFDYFTMLGKLGLAPVEPGVPYLAGTKGPLAGARLLFGAQQTAGISSRVLDTRVAELGADLGVGMQVMEDALCNWQKSPARFIAFRG